MKKMTSLRGSRYFTTCRKQKNKGKTKKKRKQKKKKNRAKWP